MENCKQIQELIFDSVDGLATTEQRKAVEEHLQKCNSCLQLYEGVAAVKAALKQLTPLKTSPDFETVLRTRISMERSLSRKGVLQWPARGSVLTFAGAAAITMAILFVNFSGHEPLTQSPPPAVSSYSTTPNPANSTFAKQPYTQATHVKFPIDIIDSKSGTPIEYDTQRSPKPDSLQNMYLENVNLEF